MIMMTDSVMAVIFRACSISRRLSWSRESYHERKIISPIFLSNCIFFSTQLSFLLPFQSPSAMEGKISTLNWLEYCKVKFLRCSKERLAYILSLEHLQDTRVRPFGLYELSIFFVYIYIFFLHRVSKLFFVEKPIAETLINFKVIYSLCNSDEMQPFIFPLFYQLKDIHSSIFPIFSI